MRLRCFYKACGHLDIFLCHSQLTVLGVSTVLSHPSWSLVAMPTRFLEYSMCAGVLSETVQFILQVFCCLIMIRFTFMQFQDKLRVCKPVARVVFLSFSLSGTFWSFAAAPFGSHTQKAGTIFNLLFHRLLNCIHNWGQVIEGWGEGRMLGSLLDGFPSYRLPSRRCLLWPLLLLPPQYFLQAAEQENKR